MRLDLLILPIFIILLLGGASQGPDPYLSGGIHGVVTDTSGNPIIGVTILLDDGYMGVMTDAAGRYLIEDVPEGTYALIAHIVGMNPVEIKHFHVPGDSLVQLDLQLQTGCVGGRSTRDTLPFTETWISIRFSPHPPESILSDFALSIRQGYLYTIRGNIGEDSILRFGAPEGEFTLCWHFPANGVGWLPLHLKENEELELTLPTEPDPLETSLGKKVIRTYSGSHPLVLSELTPDEWVHPEYRIERTCIDCSLWRDDDSLVENRLLKCNACWDSANRWRIVLLYANRIVLLQEGYPPSIIELPFRLNGTGDHLISEGGHFVIAPREGSPWRSLGSYVMIELDNGRILGYDPGASSDEGSSESQASGGENFIQVSSLGSELFDQGVLIVPIEGRTLICRAGDSHPESLSWDTLAVEMEPLGINEEGQLLAFSQDSSLISQSGPSFETNPFLALCKVSSDGEFSYTEIDTRDWNSLELNHLRHYYDPTSMTVLIWNSFGGQICIISAESGESIWGPFPTTEGPYAFSALEYAPGGSSIVTRSPYSDSDPFNVFLFPLDTQEAPLSWSGDAGLWTLGPLADLSASGNTMWDLYLPGEQPLGQSAGYLRRRALLSPEGRLLWLGPTRVMISYGNGYGPIDTISDDGLSFIWSDDRQIQICRLIPE